MQAEFAAAEMKFMRTAGNRPNACAVNEFRLNEGIYTQPVMKFIEKLQR
jgi:hypothetical protein